MPESDHVLRVILFLLFLSAVCMTGPAGRQILPYKTWPIRLLFIGFAMLLVYGLTGQVKAVVLDIPFDAVSYFGLLAASVINAGSVWFLIQQRRDERK